MTKFKLPDPDNSKTAQAARAKQQELGKQYGALADKEADLQEKLKQADQGGADYETLQALEQELAKLERELELVERALSAADLEAVEARAAAEGKTKAAAAAEGKKICERVLAAIEEIKACQADYKALTGELDRLVNFKNPNVESSGLYTGPDPGPVFKPESWPVIGFRERAELFLADWPKRQQEKEPEARTVPMPNQFILN